MDNFFFFMNGLRLRGLIFILIIIGASGCCASKKPGIFERVRNQTLRQRDLQTDRQAMDHFSAAKLLAREGNNNGAVAELEAALESDPDSAYLRKVLAFMLYQQGNTDRSLELIKESIEINPEQDDAYQIMGLILIETGKPAEAEDAFLKAAALNPDSPDHILSASEAMLRQNKPRQAMALLDKFASRHPDDIDSRYYMAAILNSAGRVDDAAARYREILDHASYYYPALSDLFKLEASRGNLDQAVAAGRSLLSQYPGDYQSRLLLVELLLHQGRSDDALDVLEAGKRSGLLTPDWWLKKGYILLRQDRALEAKEEFEGALSLDPKNVEAVLGMGIAEAMLDNYVDAMSYFESIPAASEFYPEARKQLALTALRNGETERAFTIMENLHRKAPDNVSVCISYAAMLRDLGRLDQAERLIKEALDKNPGDPGLVYELAMIFYFQGRVESSVKLTESLLANDADNPQFLNFIGYTWAEQGIKLDEAEAMIRRALAITPGAGNIMDSLGWIYYQRGDYKTAMDWLQKALEASGPDPEILEHIGDCWLAMGRRAKAKETYARALTESAGPSFFKSRIEKKLEDLE